MVLLLQKGPIQEFKNLRIQNKTNKKLYKNKKYKFLTQFFFFWQYIYEQHSILWPNPQATLLRKILDLDLLCLCFSAFSPDPTETNDIIVSLDLHVFKPNFVNFTSILRFLPPPPANLAHDAFSLVFMGFHRLWSIWVNKVLWCLSSPPQTCHCGPDDIRWM